MLQQAADAVQRHVAQSGIAATGEQGLVALLAGLSACVQTPSGRTQLELYSESLLESQATALYDEMLDR